MLTHKAEMRIFLVWIITFTAYALSYTTFGASIAVIASYFKLSSIETGTLASSLPLGFLATLAGGFLSDRFGKNQSLLLGLRYVR